MLTRGLRNNNPGNHERGTIPWKGLRPVQTDPRFCQFQTMADGVRAVAVTLLSYYNIHKLTTVRQIVSRWAPPSENDTVAYIKHVSDELGVAPDSRIQCNREVWDTLCDAIFEHENGSQVKTAISTDDLLSGVNAAFEAKGL